MIRSSSPSLLKYAYRHQPISNNQYFDSVNIPKLSNPRKPSIDSEGAQHSAGLTKIPLQHRNYKSPFNSYKMPPASLKNVKEDSDGDDSTNCISNLISPLSADLKSDSKWNSPKFSEYDNSKNGHQMDDTVNTLKNKNDQLNNDNKALNRKLSILENELSIQNLTNIPRKGEKNTLNSDRTNYAPDSGNRKILELERQLESKNDALEALKEKIIDLSHSNDSMKGMMEKKELLLTQLREKLAKNERAVEGLQQSIDEKDAEISDLVDQLNTMSKAFNDLYVSNSHQNQMEYLLPLFLLGAEIERSNAALKASHQELFEMKNKIRFLLTVEQENKELSKKLSLTDSRLDKLLMENTKLNKELNEKDKSLNFAASNLQMASSVQKNNFEQNLCIIFLLAAENDRLNTAFNKTNQVFESKSTDFDNVCHENIVLKNKLYKLEQECKDLQGKENNYLIILKELSDNKSEAENEYELLKKAHQDLHNKVRELLEAHDSSAHVQSLEKEIEILTRDSKKMANAFKDLTENNDELQRENDRLKLENQHIKKELTKIVNEKQHLMEVIDSLDSELNDKKRQDLENQSKNQHFESIASEKRKLMMEIDALKSEIGLKDEENTKLLKNLQEIKKEKNQALSENEILNEINEKAQKDLQELKKKVVAIFYFSR